MCVTTTEMIVSPDRAKFQTKERVFLMTTALNREVPENIKKNRFYFN